MPGREVNRRELLRSALHGHEPADAAEAAHRTAMQELIEAPGDPFDRAHYQPGHFTNSAFVLDPSRTRLLLILHTALGKWLQPGGHSEPHDPDLLAGARREVVEETGLAGDDLVPLTVRPIDLDVHEIPARKGAPVHRHFDVRFVFAARRDALTDTGEVSAAAWVPLPEVPARSDDASVRRVLARLQRLPRWPLLEFFRGLAPDDCDRSLAFVLTRDDAWLELTHDFIQWLFPLPEPSGANPDAPTLDARQIAEFHADPGLRQELLRAFDRMLRFYGFERHGERILRAATFAVRRREWLTPFNHNLLRVSRILRCLTLCGLRPLARAWFAELEVLHQGDARQVIGPVTRGYWQRAVEAGT